MRKINETLSKAKTLLFVLYKDQKYSIGQNKCHHIGFIMVPN